MSAKSIKSLEQHHNHLVKMNGSTYRIIVANLFGRTLVDAESVYGPDRGQIISLNKSRSNVANSIRERISLNLVS